jgi:hypothetical protein
VVPRAGVRGTWYLDGPPGAPETNEVDRVVYGLGAEASVKFWRKWTDVQVPALGIRGLRHMAQPFVDYHWTPRPDVRPGELYQFDTYRYAPLVDGSSILVSRYRPLDLGEDNAIDAHDKQNTLRFGLRQQLQTQRDGITWNLMELEAWSDWHIEREPAMDEFGDVFGTVRLQPVGWFRAETVARFDPNAGKLRELNTALQVHQGDRWSAGLGTRFLEQDSNLLSVDFAVRLGRRWVFQTYQRFDMQDGQWEEQEYMLRQETHDWFINYGVRFRGERINEDEITVFLSVTLKAFPGVRIGLN